MSIESTIAGVAESAIASTAESAVSSVAGSVISSAVSSFNPLTYVKWAGCAVGIAAAIFLIWKLANFVGTAYSDHAQIQVVTAERDVAIKAAADTAEARAADKVEADKIAASANAANAATIKLQTAINKQIEAIRNAPKTSGCKPSAALLNSLGGM